MCLVLLPANVLASSVHKYFGSFAATQSREYSAGLCDFVCPCIAEILRTAAKGGGTNDKDLDLGLVLFIFQIFDDFLFVSRK